MSDFTDSLINNIDVHSTSSPVMTSVNMGQLGEKLRQARTSTIASLSQALSSNNNNNNKKSPSLTATTKSSTKSNHQMNNNNLSNIPSQQQQQQTTGTLEINIVEGRNLTIMDATKSDPYCIVQYEDKTTSTLDKNEDTILPSLNNNNNNTNESSIHDANKNAFKAFEILMKASSPKWMHRFTFDASSGRSKISVYVYDRGNKLENGEDRFLGMSSIVPNLLNDKTVELIFPLHQRPNDQQEVTGDVRIQATYRNIEKTNLKPEDFRIIRLIGQGSVGKVYEVMERRDTKKHYAMKVLSKRLLLQENQVDQALVERTVLAELVGAPFITHLKYSFQTTNHLFLVMDYFPGGELFDFLERERCLSEKRCQLFASEIICALDLIHSKHFVYRNLKPESILLDAQGHLALTDFGLCCQQGTAVQDHAAAGGDDHITKEYLAPEMIKQQGHYDEAVDWWSLGILLYELLTGSPPFHSVDDQELYRQILEDPVKFPAGSCISDEAKDFINSLLEKDVTKRLKDIHRIKSHSFFKEIQWDLVYQKKIQLPFSPEVEEELQEEAKLANETKTLSISNNNNNNNNNDNNMNSNSISNNQSSNFVTPENEQKKFKDFTYVREDDSAQKLGQHKLNIHPEDEDPEIDFWFRK